MENIIVCGTVGTGKSNITKKLSKELKLTYINDWALFKELGMSKKPSSKLFSKIIATFLKDKQNIVLDLDMSIMPKDFVKNNINAKVYYIGFVDVLKKDLAQKLYENDVKNMVLATRTAKHLLKCGKVLCKECKKANLPFYTMCGNRDKKIKEMVEIIKNDIKNKTP